MGFVISLKYVVRPTGPKNLNFSTTSDSYSYFFNGLFGGSKEPNKRGFIQIGPYKPLKRAPKDVFFLRSYETSRFLK